MVQSRSCQTTATEGTSDYWDDAQKEQVVLQMHMLHEVGFEGLQTQV